MNRLVHLGLVLACLAANAAAVIAWQTLLPARDGEPWRKLPAQAIFCSFFNGEYQSPGRPYPHMSNVGRSWPTDMYLMSVADGNGSEGRVTHVYVDGEDVDGPNDKGSGTQSGSLWLTVYFGTAGSEPPVWKVQSVEQRGNTFRVSFSMPKREMMTLDEHDYFVWVSLGKLKPQTYLFELYNVDLKQVTLMRRFKVGS